MRDYSHREAGFNPTLVRLRQAKFEIPEIGEEMFQSHAGSIEANKRGKVVCVAQQVSIPRWFD